jgi:hypothetical protein
MPIEFVPQTETHREAVDAFNRRLQDALGQVPFLLPTEDAPRTGLIQARHYLAVDGHHVRGGYLLFSFPAFLNGAETLVANIQSPLSESIADKRYAPLPMQMVRQFLRHNPLCFCAGMGEATNALPRLLRAAGWSVEAVPFLFRVHRAARFLSQLPALRSPWWKRIGARAAAWSGAGALGRIWLHRRRVPRPSGLTLVREQAWGSWADSVWQAFQAQVRFAVRRDAAVLAEMYPPADPRLRIYRVTSGANTAGWATALLTPMHAHPHFGNLRVATILDGAALPEAFFRVAALADEALAREGADLVITNQSLLRWREAFALAGFRAGPSNYQFACSPRLAASLSKCPVADGLVHITRGDGDGRIHL